MTEFFHTEVPSCDFIVSNLPYSLKEEILKRLYEIEKPFAMRINFQGIFDSKERFRMFKENWVEMLWLSPRVYYMTAGRLCGHPSRAAICAAGYVKTSLSLIIMMLIS